MISKIVWPETFDEGNPFGGVNGFRPIRITFHNSSFTNIESDEKKALDILMGLARLDEVDALSFDGSVPPKISIDEEKTDRDLIGIKIIDEEGETISFSGVSKSCLKPSYIGHLLGSYSSNEEEKNRLIRQEILEGKSHAALRRDILITSSTFLLKNRDKLNDLNIYSPIQSLKIVGLFLRMKGEFEWISHVIGKARFITSSQTFYQFLARGLLPCSWKFTSGLGLHVKRNTLLPLGWSVINRFSRALQARDEIARLFYMPPTTSSIDQMQYHFDYLTLLLTGALDAQSLLINYLYGLGLKDYCCGLRRNPFKEEVENNHATNNINKLLDSKGGFTKILYDLRNKIHSVSININFHVPVSQPDELFERIYQYDQKDHFGIQKENVTVIENRSDPVPSIRYSIDLYNLANSLIIESTDLINSLMKETNIEAHISSKNLSKIRLDPPDDMVPFIQTYMFLA